MKKNSILILEDGTIFHGENLGQEETKIGEIVFNTSMTGYQEIITDPSYCNQLILFTSPHIGNVGVNDQDMESDKIQINGLIAKKISTNFSNFRGQYSLVEFLKKQKIPTISGIDTRKLTKILRKKGTQFGCIHSIKNFDCNKTLKMIQQFKKKIINDNSAEKIGSKKVYQWFFKKKNNQTEKILQKNNILQKKKKLNVIVYDFGVKKNILKILYEKKCNIIIVPPKYNFEHIKILEPSGILLSNGPGDPRIYHSIIKNIKKIIKKNIPILGICLGHQLLALSAGAKIIKMKTGHHGSNHPIKNLKNQKVYITSQNHNFTIDPISLNKNIIVTHISLFDKTIQGIKLKKKYAFGIQGHPESNPGPQDLKEIFNKFIKMMKKQETKNAKKK